MKKLLLSFVITIAFVISYTAQENYFPLRVGDKFGVCDINKNIVIEPKYNFAKVIFEKNNYDGIDYIVAYKDYQNNKGTAFIKDGKVILEKDNYLFYSRRGSLLLASFENFNNNPKLLLDLYSNQGESLSSKQYKEVNLALESESNELFELFDENGVNELKIYDIQKRKFSKVLIENYKVFEFLPVNQKNFLKFKFEKDNKHFLFEAYEAYGKLEYFIEPIEFDPSKLNYDNSIDSNSPGHVIVENPVNRPIRAIDPYNRIKDRLSTKFKENESSIENFTIEEFNRINTLSTPYHIIIEQGNNPFFMVNANGLKGLYTLEGYKEILPIEFDSIYVNGRNTIIAKKDNKYYNYNYNLYTNELNVVYSGNDKYMPILYWNYQKDNSNLMSKWVLNYNPDTLEFSHYALIDGTEFILD